MSLGLLGAYHGSSSDSESSGAEEAEPPKSVQDLPKPKLANPFEAASSVDTYKPSYMVETKEYHGGSKPAARVSDSSVFSNPFKAKEDRKKALLERHVEMTSKQEDSKTLRGKKICWNFRKGRCRFGSKCTFAHDNDVAMSKADEGGDTSEGAATTQQLPPVQLGAQDPDPSTPVDNNIII